MDAEATIARVKARCQEGRDGPYAMYTNVVKDDILDILDQPGEQVPDQVTTINPGQTLILRYAHQISQADAATIKTRVAERIPGIVVIVIDGCAQMIVYQPDSTAASWPLDA